MKFDSKPVIACVHLLPTLGSHRYDGDVEKIYETAIAEAKVFLECGVDALIVENFRDGPFFPGKVSTETTTTIAGVTREIVRLAGETPVGVAVLRNDAEAAMAIAAATGAQFIRVNVHVGAVLAAQGVIEGGSHDSLRLRSRLLAQDVQILADAGVKHSNRWAYPTLAEEVRDVSPFADAVIVSGALTGLETDSADLRVAKEATSKPVLVGSGATPSNLEKLMGIADGFIVGSFFKVDGVPTNEVDPDRVRAFMTTKSRLLPTFTALGVL